MLLTRRHAAAAIFCALAQHAWAEKSARQPLIVLDPGHTPQQPGALSARGIYEVDYNDRFVAELAPQLQAAGWRVAITRLPPQSISLSERANIANRLGADLFLSIHHDSTRAQFMIPIEYKGRTAQMTASHAPFHGYSVFISELNPQFGASYAFAHFIAQRIRALGRTPALYHADPRFGSARPLYDETLGIYRYDNLAVLRHTTVAAVLLEIGVLPNVKDEAWLSAPENRRAMQQAIVGSVREYQKSRFYRATP